MNKTRQWLAPIDLWVLAAILTICGGILFSGCTDDNDNPVVNPEYTTLKEALQGIDRISDIKENPDTAAIRKKSEGLLAYKEQYSMAFRQDLNHDVPDGDTFEQRERILYMNYNRVKADVDQLIVEVQQEFKK